MTKRRSEAEASKSNLKIPANVVLELKSHTIVFMGDSYTAYIDESFSVDWFVLAGHIASDKNWETFDLEWKEFLPWAPASDDGRQRFKLSEMGHSDESLERVAAFYRVIEKHVACSVSVIIRLSELVRARRRIIVWGREIAWDLLKNPYVISFKMILDTVYLNRHLLREVVPLDASVEFVFDDRAEKKTLLGVWGDYVASLPADVRQLVTEPPTFADEEYVLPLQAADLWAGIVRRWTDNRSIGKEPSNLAELKVKNDRILDIVIAPTEDELVKAYMQGIRRDLPGALILDIAKFTTAYRSVPRAA